MENKKDIGRAVRDKIDGMHKQPAPAVWESIRADLDANRKRSRLPLWATVGGIVTVVLLLVIFSYPLWEGVVKSAGKKTEQIKGTVEGTANQVNGNDGTDNTDAAGNSVTSNPNNRITANEDASESTSVESSGKGDANAVESNVSTDKSDPKAASGNNRASVRKTGKAAIRGKSANAMTTANSGSNAAGSIKNGGSRGISSNNKAANSTTSQDKALKGTDKSTKNKTASSNAKVRLKSHKTDKEVLKKTAQDDNDAVANSGSDAEKNAKERNATARTAIVKTSIGKTVSDESSSDNAGTAANRMSGTGENTNADNNNSSTKAILKDKTGETNSTSVTDAGQKGDTAVTVADTIVINAGILKDSLAVAQATDSLAKKKKEPATDEKKTANADDYKQFYAFVYAAPAVFKYPSGTSLLGRELNGNKAKSKPAIGYGAFLGYEITEHWGIRAGVSITRTEQETSGVVSDTTGSIVPSYSGISYAQGVSNQSLASQFDGQPFTLVQKTQFTEVPIELTYTLTGERWGIKAIGGISTVRISSNEVIAQNSSSSLYVGSLKNTSAISFSAGLGAGLYYKILPSLQVNAEPFARYYINTFNNASPISFTVRVGLQYTFNFGTKKE